MKITLMLILSIMPLLQNCSQNKLIDTQNWLKQYGKDYTLEELKHIKNLDLKYKEITDITPINTLTTLNSLDLTGTKITDITPLSNLTNLKELYLSDTKISNLQPLSNLKHLEMLMIIKTDIKNLTPLKTLKTLEMLFLDPENIPKQQVDDIKKILPRCRINYPDIKSE